MMRTGGFCRGAENTDFRRAGNRFVLAKETRLEDARRKTPIFDPRGMTGFWQADVLPRWRAFDESACPWSAKVLSREVTERHFRGLCFLTSWSCSLGEGAQPIPDPR